MENTEKKQPDDGVIGPTEGVIEADDLLDELDIEAYSGSDRKPRARRYIFRVDRQRLVTEKPELTGSEILTVAGKIPPENYMLFQNFRGGHSEKVSPTQLVDLRSPGVEKFRTLPRDQTEG